MGNSKSSEFCPKHGRHCLAPLFFHEGVLGTQVCLSLGGRRVERNRETFQNGLTFSSCPIRVQEKIHLRVELCDQHWNGALRVGFTSIPPSSCGPLFPPAMAIPDLTTIDRYWAAPVPSSLNMPEAELRFWVTPKGVLVCEGQNRVRYLLLEGVDVRSPLWAIIDVYGQTRAVLLLGSKQKGCNTCRSCPYEDSCMCVNKGLPSCTPRGIHLPTDPITTTQMDSSAERDLVEDCAVCLSLRASVVLSCGHRCLCQCCAVRVTAEFGICPLCRQSIR
ncbi:E3 ubiquitin-protein ligase NEURL3-like isoform X1 [Oncorhynchus keta]|uniref:E3 ubiquitin-protein ligase NEURL3-like isoform X1 n=1 Tax=Oncorhynchus keta TaxID=8018 RepID=UPI0015FCF56E|nr:E3 ubiquitin-protein ligase NEURL3-like isoform X1 [Oncorhynchus keta]